MCIIISTSRVSASYNQYFTSISINKCVQNCVKLDCAIAVCLNIEMILCLYNIRAPCQDDGMKVVAL